MARAPLSFYQVRVFSAAERDLLETLADLCAHGLERALQYAACAATDTVRPTAEQKGVRLAVALDHSFWPFTFSDGTRPAISGGSAPASGGAPAGHLLAPASLGCVSPAIVRRHRLCLRAHGCRTLRWRARNKRRPLAIAVGAPAARTPTLRQLLLVRSLQDVFSLTLTSGDLVVVRIDVVLAHGRYAPRSFNSVEARTRRRSHSLPHSSTQMRACKGPGVMTRRRTLFAGAGVAP